MKVIGAYKVKGEKNVSLVELMFEEKPSTIDVGKITQEVKGKDPSNWQAAWDEKYLDENGGKIIGDYKIPEEDKGPTRLIFFFHYLDFTKTLRTQYGELSLPKPTEMPDRLVKLVKYESPD